MRMGRLHGEAEDAQVTRCTQSCSTDVVTLLVRDVLLRVVRQLFQNLQLGKQVVSVVLLDHIFVVSVRLELS